MAQVLVRQRELRGNVTKLVEAEVLSSDRGTLRVQVKGQRHPIEVKESDTLAMTYARPGSATFNSARVQSLPRRAYPRSTGALANRLY